MFKRSDIPGDVVIAQTDITVQTAKSGSTLNPIGRADIGSTYRQSLVFEDDELEKNLISFPRLDDDGCDIRIFGGKVTVKKNDRVILEGEKEGHLYQFDLDDTETAMLADTTPRDRETKLRRFHNVSGHRNLLRISKYIKTKKIIINGFPKDVSENEIKALPLCDACQRSKFTKRRLKRYEKNNIGRGERVTTDMKGPIRVKGLGGERYYQGFLDAHTKFLVHRCFAQKSEAYANLEEVLLDPLYRGSLAEYHADGAPELISAKIVKALKEQGVKVSFSAPYTSTDNAAIERNHRTIFESAHALLLHACLSTSFWCYAVAHAVYLYNRIPTNTALGYLAPVTAAFDTIVDLTEERTFGCICYAMIPSQTRAKGFTDKAYKGYYLGHRPNNSPGFIVFFIEENKIKEVSHVTFDESDLDTGARNATEDPIGLSFSSVSKNPKDFDWLVGMAYRDEGGLFLTTRVLVQHGMIVAYRAIVVDSTVGTEETRPVHVAEVEALVKEYLGQNSPTLDLGESQLSIIGEDYNEKGDKEKAGPPATMPRAGGGGDNDESDNMVVDDRPMGARKNSSMSPVERPPAPIDQNTPTGQTMGDGEPPVTSESLGTKRERKMRIPLNIGVMGDIEKTFYIVDKGVDYEYNIYDESYGDNSDILLYDDVLKSGEVREWMKAGREEANSIILENRTWTPAILPRGFKALTTKWIFKKKKKPDGTVRYKARLCVRGFKQRLGVDYSETYAPTAKWVTLRLFLTIAACKKMVTRQLDVKTAFLYAPLDEEVYITVPAGLTGNSNPFGLSEEALKKCRGRVLRLLKSLYGLKQAPRNWFKTLRKFLTDEGFTNLLSESCLFAKYADGLLILIIIFVDDILAAAERESDLIRLVQAFRERFNITDSGEVNVYLSINICRHFSELSMALDQTAYIEQTWKAFKGVENVRVTTPLQENWRINIDDELSAQSREDRAFVERFPYRELVGSLLFLQICTRGDIAYAVHYLSRFNSKPCKSACLAAKRLLQYLYNTRYRKLKLGGTARPLLSLFCDSDFASCLESRKSVECFLLFFGEGCIMWQVKQQPRVAQSTSEAEYCTITPGVNMVVWIRELLHEMSLGYVRASAIYTDNDVARSMVENPVHHSRMKQIGVKYHMLRQLVELNIICAGRIATLKGGGGSGEPP